MQPITIRSRELRKKQTPAEMLVWERVRDRKLGVKMVRQKPVLLDYFGGKKAFIADFYCHEIMLIIEIDGNVHSKRSDYDSLRTLLLQQKGLRLIRFTNSEVFNDIHNVMSRIMREIEKSPHPAIPSPRMERGRQISTGIGKKIHLPSPLCGEGRWMRR